MAKIITSNDWNEIWGDSEQNGIYYIQLNDNEIITQGQNPYLGKTQTYWNQLGNGLSIHYTETEMVDDFVIIKNNLNEPEFGLSFFLSGKVIIQRHGLTGKNNELVGKYYSHCDCGVKETEWWTAGEKFSRIYIKIQPQKFFHNFQEDDLPEIPTFLRQSLTDETIQPYYDLGKITTQMQRVLQQILNCPYQGLMKQIYLQSKVMELIVFHFEQCQHNQLRDCRLKTQILTDIDRIYQAREILLSNLENPPSLIELARQVGLNDFKLKRGFRQVFGTSAFKYLHDYRLEQAKQLLMSRRIRIEDVSTMVGFRNTSYFASAFRQKFGVNPKEFQKQYN